MFCSVTISLTRWLFLGITWSKDVERKMRKLSTKLENQFLLPSQVCFQCRTNKGREMEKERKRRGSNSSQWSPSSLYPLLAWSTSLFSQKYHKQERSYLCLLENNWDLHWKFLFFNRLSVGFLRRYQEKKGTPKIELGDFWKVWGPITLSQAARHKRSYSTNKNSRRSRARMYTQP